jgi:hypothetical protein
MSGFYELKCLDNLGFYAYYYFYSPRAIRNPKTAINSGYAPDGMRIVVDDSYHKPVSVRFIHNPLEYIYLKYFKKAGTFHLGHRVNWEKEIKKILDN